MFSQLFAWVKEGEKKGEIGGRRADRRGRRQDGMQRRKYEGRRKLSQVRWRLVGGMWCHSVCGLA
jgi:hypothetical protein